MRKNGTEGVASAPSLPGRRFYSPNVIEPLRLKTAPTKKNKPIITRNHRSNPTDPNPPNGFTPSLFQNALVLASIASANGFDLTIKKIPIAASIRLSNQFLSIV